IFLLFFFYNFLINQIIGQKHNLFFSDSRFYKGRFVEVGPDIEPENETELYNALIETTGFLLNSDQKQGENEDILRSNYGSTPSFLVLSDSDQVNINQYQAYEILIFTGGVLIIMVLSIPFIIFIKFLCLKNHGYHYRKVEFYLVRIHNYNIKRKQTNNHIILKRNLEEIEIVPMLLREETKAPYYLNKWDF
ncbi:hypothetical protein HZS_3892, partial [Henneguya salminicola]